LEASDRKKLEELAVERLMATANDEEQWSFCFRTEGAVSAIYCPWQVGEDAALDGEIEGLDLPWTPERLDLIKRSQADPTEKELRQWAEAYCRKMVTDAYEGLATAWAVPLWIDQKIAAYALFVAGADEDPDDPPLLKGVFDTLEEAGSALDIEGVAEGTPPSWE